MHKEVCRALLDVKERAPRSGPYLPPLDGLLIGGDDSGARATRNGAGGRGKCVHRRVALILQGTTKQ